MTGQLTLTLSFIAHLRLSNKLGIQNKKQVRIKTVTTITIEQ